MTKQNSPPRRKPAGNLDAQALRAALSAYGADKRRWPPALRRQLEQAQSAPPRRLAAQLRREAELDRMLVPLHYAESPAAASAHAARLMADFDAHARARPQTVSSWRLGAMLAAGFALGMWSGFWITDYIPLPAGGPSYVTALLETAIGDGITRFFP